MWKSLIAQQMQCLMVTQDMQIIFTSYKTGENKIAGPQRNCSSMPHVYWSVGNL